MQQPSIEHSSQNLQLMSAMARPKPLAIQQAQLLSFSRRVRQGCLLLVVSLALLTITTFSVLTLNALISLVFLGCAEALLLISLSRLIPARLGNAAATLPRNVANLNLLMLGVILAIALTTGPLAAYFSSQVSSATYYVLSLAACAAASGLALTLGVNLTSFCLLASVPICWMFAPYLHGLDWQPWQWISLGLVASFLVVLSAAWYHHQQRQRIRQLQMDRLVSYLDNARTSTSEVNAQLSHELGLKEMSEHELREALRELESTLKERTEALTETNQSLQKQMKLRKNISDALVKSQTRLSQAIEATGLALWDWNLKENSIYQSYFHPAFGPREMPASGFFKRMESVVHSDDSKKAAHQIQSTLKGMTDRYRIQYRVQLDNQEWMWVEDCGKVVQTEPDGTIARILGTRRDITLDKRRDEQLRLAKSVFDHTSEGVFALDDQLRFLTVNNAFRQITGYSPDEIIGKSLEEFSHTPNKEKVFNLIREELALKGSWRGELYEKRKNGDYYSQRLQLKAIINSEGNIAHYAGLFSDLTERKEVDEKLHYLVNYDDLTGLANRVLFKDRLHQQLGNIRQHGDKLALLLIDVDRFSQVNESLGHDKADELLRAIAARISNAAQEADTVARLGNDEFAILMATKHRVQVAKFCEVLLEELKQPYQIGSQELFISTSIGITQAPDSAREIQALMQQANTAVRQAKYLGGNTYEFYSRMLQGISSHRLSVETELRKALQQDQLEVFYQPKLCLSSASITGVEALIRWRHPEKGLIPPKDFVPIAEESGLITGIGEFVLYEACRQAQTWNQMGLGDISVAVNVSARQLRQSNLPLIVRDALAKTGLTPSSLDLELTESSLMENLSHTQTTLSRFRDMGIKVTIDDFGTGYSSLSYLKRFPINALKVDRMFISDVHENADDAAITRAIILLAKSLNLEVIAEGVEIPPHMDFLRANHCDTAQGFLIDRPLDAGQITARLQQQLENPIELRSS